MKILEEFQNMWLFTIKYLHTISKMWFFCFMISLTFSEILIQFGDANKEESALVIQRTDNELQFPSIITDKEGYFRKYALLHDKLLLLCHDKHPDALDIAYTVTDDNFRDSDYKCRFPVEPSIFKVNAEFRNDDAQSYIHLYQIGFTVADAEFNNIIRVKEYESLINENYRFMPMISVYRYKELHLTLAVSYEVLKVDLRKEWEDSTPVYYSSHHFIEKNEEFYYDQKSKLKDILGLIYNEDIHSLSLESLINENNFIIDSWKKTARHKVHQILIWRENVDIWRDVQEMVRNIANIPDSHTIITAGSGKVLTITDIADETYTMQWFEGEDTVFIPELYWIALKFTKSDKTTGMFVIMDNEPIAEGNDVKKICNENYCLSHEVWVQGSRYDDLKGRVYCCPIDSVTIKKLQVGFLLEELDFLAVSGIPFPPSDKSSASDDTNSRKRKSDGEVGPGGIKNLRR